jgi:hypothetical protein
MCISLSAILRTKEHTFGAHLIPVRGSRRVLAVGGLAL